METILETDKLTKRFGRFEAVRDLSVRVPRGSICAFLGQNGAGKSTTLRMLLGMMRPTEGSGCIFGLRIDDEVDSVRIRERVAFVAEDKRLYDYMTVRQIVRFTKSFFPRWREGLENDLLRRFELPLDRKIRKLSKGMRTKLALLLAFARGSEFFILDEPTEGLDPVATEMVLQAVVSLAAEGATVFFSSHQIAEVEQIADHVLMIHKGKLVLDSPLDCIKDEYRQVQAVINRPVQDRDFELDGVERVYVDGSTVSLIVSHNVEDVMNRAHELNAISVEVAPLTLKEIFLETVKARS
ncbi:MAG TPA: ABC transporter ATP-binding protein [Candidatus Acidoferrum sp.]|jgi:ABC-2 type transport system ATP-binding protein